MTNDDAAAELRDMAEAILQMSADARRAADELVTNLLSIVDLQCAALEERASAILEALPRTHDHDPD